MIKYQINEKFSHLEAEILGVPERFESEQGLIRDIRNVIKVLDIGGHRCVVKMFRQPNIINRVAYAYIRSSKAQRSFENAIELLRCGILTPEPVAYIVFSDIVGVTHSYYISMALEYDFDFWRVVRTPPHDVEKLLLAFTHFTYTMQEQHIYFKDHSPGNTLIKCRADGEYEFWLVDLNRIEYRKMSLRERIHNFSRLGLKGEQLDIVSREISLLLGADLQYVRRNMVR